ncbi:MAG TPA: glycoside hydrolase family 9 protein [Candidatus Limnocylindrales bacterium]|nr:glycoside hydrolase family 9 protein [Candidatus Limnocylindrales bacterium]
MLAKISTLLVLIGLFVVPAPASAATELIVNGTFDNGHAPWWGTHPMSSATQQLCMDVPGGTANPWDVIIGQDNIPLQAGESYEFKFDAPGAMAGKALVQLPMDPWTQYVAINLLDGSSGSFTMPIDLPNAQVVFQIGGRAEPWRFCLDNVSLQGGAAPPVYVPDTGPRVRVNQHGYLINGPKDATLVTEATAAVPWQLKSVEGDRVVASGQTRPLGVDPTSGQNTHGITLNYRKAGRYVLVADGETSHPFTIGDNLYTQLRDDALKFYYPQRSGIAITRPGYERPAGHVGVAPNTGDTNVPCQPGVCDYTLNVSGGWYDAGDHGKYVVNGGISVHQLMSEFERNRSAFADGQLQIPESGNGVPDILDEARWELQFILSMQVPDGKPLAGMAHHKIHDNNWTGLPLLPHMDPMLRELHPPSTAATLNLAAVAAQGARLFARYDRAFAAKCLVAAEKAWAAAKANPERYASPADGNGGGAYDDVNVTDEFYWAAAELYITTGAKEFKEFLLASPHHTGDIFTPRGFDWQWVAPLGRLELATVPNNLPGRAQARKSIVDAADRYLAAQAGNAYGLTYTAPNGMFDWGSNNLVLNNLVVVATAADLTGEKRYTEGVARGMDYILGRNALNISYVTGYGTKFSQNQHSRWYSHQLNPDLPHPPPGALAGGPNSSIQDPLAQRKLVGCVGQFCYIDDIESWSTNELTINWNSPLSWVTSFLAAPTVKGDCRVDYTRLAQWDSGFVSLVSITNTGRERIDGWELQWSFLSGQTVGTSWGASLSQSGATVTATSSGWTSHIAPGRSVTIGFLGTPGSGPNPDPEVFLLSGGLCG